ncbi:MAG TPA: hypothetical protein VFS75_00165 [Candidatus Paceibacterota bacterium]|nr:hypothetical protein [Candidatus Paceibacterota bacterium]
MTCWTQGGLVLRASGAREQEGTPHEPLSDEDRARSEKRRARKRFERRRKRAANPKKSS